MSAPPGPGGPRLRPCPRALPGPGPPRLRHQRRETPAWRPARLHPSLHRPNLNLCSLPWDDVEQKRRRGAARPCAFIHSSSSRDFGPKSSKLKLKPSRRGCKNERDIELVATPPTVSELDPAPHRHGGPHELAPLAGGKCHAEVAAIESAARSHETSPSSPQSLSSSSTVPPPPTGHGTGLHSRHGSLRKHPTCLKQAGRCTSSCKQSV